MDAQLSLKHWHAVLAPYPQTRLYGLTASLLLVLAGFWYSFIYSSLEAKKTNLKLSTQRVAAAIASLQKNEDLALLNSDIKSADEQVEAYTSTIKDDLSIAEAAARHGLNIIVLGLKKFREVQKTCI